MEDGAVFNIVQLHISDTRVKASLLDRGIEQQHDYSNFITLGDGRLSLRS